MRGITWTILLMLLASLCSVGQKTTIINHFPRDTSGLGKQLVPVKTAEHRIVIQYYEPADQQVIDDFQSLVGSYLAMYIDRLAYIDDGDVRLKKSRNETVKDLNNIVKGALDFYEYEKLKDFKGFSKMVVNKVQAIDALDFSRTAFSSEASDESSRRQMEKFYLQKELSDLKLLVNMELGIFGEDNLMVLSASDETIIDEEAKRRLLENYLSYDPKVPLEPIKVQLSDESLALINFQDETNLGHPVNDSVTPGAGQDAFASQVLKLLEANNSKLDGMQKQIDELRSEQMRIWEQQQDQKNLAMQKQIDDLREMVFALVKMNSGDAVATGDKNVLPPARSEGSVSNVPGSMNVYFGKGSTTLDASSVLALNEIVDILARTPSLKLIVTGFADKTGDPAKNLILSQQRANEVKRFLMQSGLGADRFITKYFGDRDSSSESASDRRVMVEFVRQ